MGPYLNKYEKLTLCFFMGFYGYLEQLLEENHEKVRPYFKRIRTMQTYCQNIVRGMTDKIDLVQTELVRQQIGRQTLVIEPDEKVKNLKELVVLEVATVERMMRSAYGECFMCDKVMKAARDCDLRRALLDAGMPTQDNGKGVCPFKHGML